MENANFLDLLVDATENTTTTPQKVHILSVGLFASGEFDGAEITFEVSPDDVFDTELYASPDDAQWFTHPQGIFTEQDWRNADLADVWVRARLTNAGGATEVTLKLRPRNTSVIEIGG